MAAETTDNPLLISGGQVCQRLSIGKSSLHKMIRGGKFPLTPIRLSRSVRYRADQLTLWVEMGCPPTQKWLAMQAMNTRRIGGAA